MENYVKMIEIQKIYKKIAIRKIMTLFEQFTTI